MSLLAWAALCRGGLPGYHFSVFFIPHMEAGGRFRSSETPVDLLFMTVAPTLRQALNALIRRLWLLLK